MLCKTRTLMAVPETRRYGGVQDQSGRSTLPSRAPLLNPRLEPVFAVVAAVGARLRLPFVYVVQCGLQCIADTRIGLCLCRLARCH